MRVLCVSSYYKPAYIYGGPTRSVPTLCESIVELGHEVTVFTTDANGKDVLEVEANRSVDVEGVNVTYFHRDLPGNYFYSRALAQSCHNQVSKFDLVYVSSNWGFPFLPACRAARKAQVSYVVTPRTSFMRSTWKRKHMKKRLYHYAFERVLLNDASAIHYTTQLEMRESDWLKLRPPFFVVPNPVSFDEFEHLPASGQFRRKWRISVGSAVILFLGRIEPRKGLDITFLAFSRIVHDFPKARLVLAGPEEDNYQVTLRNMAKKLNIEDRLIFTGYLNASERLEALTDADLFVLTSYSENFGIAVVEAMACGLPVVISDQVGLAEVVQQENAGLVTPLDPVRISAALITLLQDTQLCQQLGCRGKRVAHEQFAPQAVARKMLKVFEDILAAGKQI